MLKVWVALTITACTPHCLLLTENKSSSKQRQHHKRRMTIKPSRLYKRRLAVRWIYGERIAWTCWQGVLFARRVRGQGAPNQGWEQVLSERHLRTQQRPATHRSTIKLRMTSVDLRQVTLRLTKLNQQPFLVQTNACTRNRQQCKHPCQTEKSKAPLL